MTDLIPNVGTGTLLEQELLGLGRAVHVSAVQRRDYHLTDFEGDIGKTNRRGWARLLLYGALLNAGCEPLQLSNRIGRAARAEARRL